MGRKRKKSKYGTHVNEKLIQARHSSVPSKSEQKIIDFFMDENIELLREVCFPNLCGRSGFSLFYDFYVPDFNLLIEFDGMHHYNKKLPKYSSIKSNDMRKTNYAHKNGYKFLRIPYWVDPVVDIIKYLDKHFPVTGVNKIKSY